MELVEHALEDQAVFIHLDVIAAREDIGVGPAVLIAFEAVPARHSQRVNGVLPASDPPARVHEVPERFRCGVVCRDLRVRVAVLFPGDHHPCAFVPHQLELLHDLIGARQEEPARKTVHARLVLDAIAQAEGLTVEDGEVDARLGREAERMGEGKAGLRRRLQEGGGLEALKIQMVREKTLDFLTSVANIQVEE